MLTRWKIAIAVMAATGLLALNADAAGDASAYDPDKQFTILKHGAALGDPAVFIAKPTERDGFTVVTTNVTSGVGLQLLLSLIEPAQNGSQGGGHVVLASIEEGQAMIEGLRKTPLWMAIPRSGGAAAFTKAVHFVRGGPGAPESVAVALVRKKNGDKAIEVRHDVQGAIKRFVFESSMALKFANQIEWHLNKAIEETGIGRGEAPSTVK